MRASRAPTQKPPSERPFAEAGSPGKWGLDSHAHRSQGASHLEPARQSRCYGAFRLSNHPASGPQEAGLQRVCMPRTPASTCAPVSVCPHGSMRVLPRVSSCAHSPCMWVCVSMSLRPHVCPCVCVHLSKSLWACVPAHLSGCVLSAYTGLTGYLSWAVCPQVFGYNTSVSAWGR